MSEMKIKVSWIGFLILMMIAGYAVRSSGIVWSDWQYWIIGLSIIVSYFFGKLNNREI
jgi:hypothetical protein